ncbi:MAG: ester cyclase [Candidatus Dormiibacterota bacterium]
MNATAEPAALITEERNKTASCRLYEEVFGRGNYAAADEILAPDVINHGPGTLSVPGAEPIKRQGALLRGAFPDLSIDLGDQFASGDRVCSRWLASGTHTGELRIHRVRSLPLATASPSRRSGSTVMRAVGSSNAGSYRTGCACGSSSASSRAGPPASEPLEIRNPQHQRPD